MLKMEKGSKICCCLGQNKKESRWAKAESHQLIGGGKLIEMEKKSDSNLLSKIFLLKVCGGLYIESNRCFGGGGGNNNIGGKPLANWRVSVFVWGVLVCLWNRWSVPNVGFWFV